MKKIKLLFVLVVFIMANKSAIAQTTIMTDISENYIARLIAHAEANYPTVKSNQARIEIAEDNISKAKVSYLNAFTFSYVYQPQGFNSAAGSNGSPTSYSYFNGIQAGLFFNLGTFLTIPYQVKEARHQLEIANYDQNLYFLTLSAQIRKMYYSYVGDIAILKFATQAVFDAQTLSSDLKQKFEKGEETFENYTRSQSQLTQAYQAKINAETTLLIAKSDLEEVLGDKLENIR